VKRIENCDRCLSIDVPLSNNPLKDNTIIDLESKLYSFFNDRGVEIYDERDAIGK
jgi:hypothetical protein